MLLQGQGDAVVIAGADGRIRVWNAAAARLFGRETADAVGRAAGEIFPDISRITEQVERAGGRVAAFAQNGEAGFTLVAAPSGLLDDILSLVADVAIIGLDLDGRIVAWGEGARRTFDHAAEAILGRAADVLYSQEELGSGRVHALLETALETGRADGVFECVRRSGEHITAEVVLSQRGAGAPTGYLLVARDVTGAKATEEHLRRRNDELAAQSRRLAEASRLKSEFLANMSHELRTPLNGIIGFAELMHEGMVGELAPEHHEYIGDILNSARHLLQLINDILDLAKVEAGKLDLRPEPIEVEEIVGNVVGGLASLATVKRIAVTTVIDPAIGTVLADPGKLRQVLFNFLSNALKFTPDDGRVEVRAVLDGPLHFRLEVEDSGLGIRPADLGRLFVEFQQLDHGAVRQGTGLGLALTRRLVEAMGGEVGVESEPGRGSRFHAVLPRAPASSVAPPSAPRPRGTAPLVLIADGDDPQRDWVLTVLERAGFAADIATSAEEAESRLATRRFDGIVASAELASRLAAAGPPVVRVVTPDARALVAALVHAGVRPRRPRTVLVIDPDPDWRATASAMLDAHGFEATCVRDAETGLRAFLQAPSAAVIVDPAPGAMDVAAFIDRLREAPGGRDTPVVVWPARRADAVALERVADAIIAKAKGDTALIAALASLMGGSP